MSVWLPLRQPELGRKSASGVIPLSGITPPSPPAFNHTLVVPDSCHSRVMRSSYQGTTCELMIKLSMRTPEPDDVTAIVSLLDEAFTPSEFESRLVSTLIKNRRTVHQWLLELEDRIVAYVCYSQAYREGAPIGWHLAAVAVHPDWQRQAHGSQLIRQTLIQSPIADSAVFVLGDPAYYARFGFCPTRVPRCAFDPGNEHFMALRYTSQDDFVIGYEPEFG